ncbi:MAG: twin-arginine translocase TatA/TatE family subunit [Anaerolineales bacterium]|nr:twin-arginine translocase TatA/TatE family subunit [Anaerolineales bacterium]
MDLNIFGIGPLELVGIMVLLLLLFGPKDLVRMAREVGTLINRFTRSEGYQTIQQASQEIRNLPQKILQETELDAVQKELKGEMKGKEPASAGPPPTAQKPLAAWTQELPAQPIAPEAPAAGKSPESQSGPA